PATVPTTFTSGTVYQFALLSTAQFLTPLPGPSSTASAGPTAAASVSTVTDAFTCPTSAGTANSIARVDASSDAPRRHKRLHPSAQAHTSGTTLLAVSYDRSTAQSNAAQIESRE